MNNRIKPEVRLQMRKASLERRYERSRQRLEENVDYFRSNVVSVAGRQVVESLEDSSPIVARILRSVLPGLHGESTVSSSRRTSTGKSSFWSNLSGGILPFLMDMGKRRILSFGLRRTGGILRFLLKGILKLI
ncbi:hypothetical protein [Porphyromonas cangingivalis]|uniref:Uncharacterized protein n=2 Tax=Porphyromonas cangingivalis TaxID=36874 RepID=A0A1T4K2W2_PORCN|nr:hypothetical protein [Porphyromonas cangingivalis]SJZ36758.1 hypothetical protein SAMN02745205_00538 [Porphyromonas cangingivalis]VEJ03397.1 Uncharacterised protein [Porphyromonas cangingivalis]